jgi:hypothetical protein
MLSMDFDDGMALLVPACTGTDEEEEGPEFPVVDLDVQK